jgi:CheY-like chemotaxis protein
MLMLGFTTNSSDPAMDEPRHSQPVLIVEDERVSRNALSSLLSASGYEPSAFDSAEAALLSLRPGHIPHIALIDLNLPGMNGLDLIKRLSELDPSIVPVLLTAASEEMIAQSLKSGDVSYVRKPVDFPSLLSLLDEKQPLH